MRFEFLTFVMLETDSNFLGRVFDICGSTMLIDHAFRLEMFVFRLHIFAVYHTIYM